MNDTGPLACVELSVRLSPSTGAAAATAAASAAAATSTSDSKVELSPADADAIDVMAGEQALVVPLVRGDDGRLHVHVKGRGKAGGRSPYPIAAVCTVDVTVAAPSGGGVGGGGKRGNKRPMKVGEAGLSQCLLRRLFDEDEDVSSAASTTTLSSTPTTNYKSQTPAASPAMASSPSPSGSKFSFARGGGGDALISPAKQKQAPPPKPSPSGSKFSFAKGGGGDAMISPATDTRSKSRIPSMVSTPDNVTANKGSGVGLLQKKVAIIPLHQLTGTWPSSQSSRSLVGIASEITLSTCSDTLPRMAAFESDILVGSAGNVPTNERPRPLQGSGPIIQRSGNVLRELILRSCRGHFVQEGDILEESFVGRSIRLRVESVASLNDRRHIGGDEDSKVCKQSSDQEYPSGSIVAQLKESVLSMEDGSSALYQICPDTEIEFCTAAPTNNNGDDTVSSISGRIQQLAISTPSTSTANIDSKERKKQVAGLDSELREIKSILLPSISRPEIFFSAAASMKPPKGILVFGSPGVGKSRLVAQVGDSLAKTNVDGERDIVIESVPSAAIQTRASIMGQAERELCRIFDRAEARASKGISTLLIVDDIHLICPRRGAVGSSGGGAAIASTLLALLDGIGSEATAANKQNADSKHSLENGPGTVMILATTSDPSRLDPALRRPGRLDIEIEIPIPDDAARADILEFLLDSMKEPTTVTCDDSSMHGAIETPVLSKQELLTMARLAKGFTGADCTLALKEALRSAILRCSSLPEDKVSKTRPIQMSLEDIRHAIRTTKPSTIRAVTVEVPRVPWSAIGGMEHVKMLLREAVELPVTHAHHFESLSLPPPRGVLLFGPPGCSKTLMARALATEGHMNFLAVKGPELLSKWLGESERALANLFRRARQASPCIIFFDEIDSIATKRGGGGNSGDRLLSQLLTELDGVSNTGVVGKGGKVGGKSQRVVVVCATNRPDLLDPALTRPGRIDRKIYVGLPDEESRQGILKVGLKGKACDDDIDVSENHFGSRRVCLLTYMYVRTSYAMPFSVLIYSSCIYLGKRVNDIHFYLFQFNLQLQVLELSREEITGGFSGAELIAICREAALFALEDCGGSARIGKKHLLRSIESTKRQITPEMLDFYASYQKEAGVHI